MGVFELDRNVVAERLRGVSRRAVPSKPNKPAHVAARPLARNTPSPPPIMQRRSVGSSYELSPRRRFPPVPSFEPHPSLVARGHHERVGDIAVLGHWVST